MVKVAEGTSAPTIAPTVAEDTNRGPRGAAKGSSRPVNRGSPPPGLGSHERSYLPCHGPFDERQPLHGAQASISRRPRRGPQLPLPLEIRITFSFPRKRPELQQGS
ncbi:hypothetical protein IscW_ISCW019305 [Ixodes scapularis]|uniref:Uncharacterized protein n=1 Tax=Ixodes scapularis TaxID=6945 RepID=B7PUJ7_IXOSC|nr:hypothetical protein IscW_ISCW019305 [Ixodes scapularis]|eukprot:XP_002406176.1 hypothetical protein IscW_ISCW019305 [Ixodes scapularis]